MFLNRLFSILRPSSCLKRVSFIKPALSVTPLASNYSTTLLTNVTTSQRGSLLNNPTIIQLSKEMNERSVTKFSMRKGKRKSVKAVPMRFYRLQWGAWVRTIAGRHNKVYLKSKRNKRACKYHVLCNARQSFLLDKMVGPYWRKRRWYVDDPYEPYHLREEHPYTYKTPRPFVPKEEQS